MAVINIRQNKIIKITIVVLLFISTTQIIKTYFYIQPENQLVVLENIKAQVPGGISFVIEDKVIVNQKGTYKVKILSNNSRLKHKRFLVEVDGKCECEHNHIYRVENFGSMALLDYFLESNRFKKSVRDEKQRASISIISPSARYKREGIFFVIHVASSSIVFIGEKEKDILDILLSIKNSFVKKVQTFIPFPYAELGHGLIISGKSALPKNIEEDFKRSGLMHIVVLSGFNVSIVIQFVFALFTFGPKFFRFGVGTLFVILFVLMAGSSSALLRATLMALIALLCTLYKKEIDGLVLLAVVAMLLITINPLSFYFDLSFWLSILATFGLISLSSFLQENLAFIPKGAGLREAGASSLATQLVVTPLLMLINPEISVLSFFANILILPIVPLTMATVFVTGVVGFIASFPALFLGHVSYLLLSYIISVTHAVSQLSFATATFGQNSFSPLFYYIFIVPLAIWLYKKKRP